MKTPVYLIGMPGSGKSTLGKKTAEILRLRFLDLDRLITQKAGMMIPEIFTIHGEDYFRLLEKDILQETATFSDSIIATGGGTACYYNNIDFMNQTGLTVYLKTSEANLTSRLLKSPTERPLIKGKTDWELSTYIKETLLFRSKFYEQAALQIDTELVNFHRLAELIKNS